MNCTAAVVVAANVVPTVPTDVVVGVVEEAAAEVNVETGTVVAGPGAPLKLVAVCVGVGNARVALNECRSDVA